MLITRLQLLTSDLIAQKEYYANVLELPTRLANQSVMVEAGKTHLVFTQAPPEWRGAYHFCFNIPENQFVQAKAWISERIPLLKDSKGNDEFQSNSWNALSLYFKDAAGNILEFIARHNLKNGSAELFDGNHILQISEIGLPAQDVIDFAKQVCQRLGVSVYQQDFNSTFTPIGDEHGLLILPAEGRVWYPNTGVPAQLLDVKVDVEVDGKEFKLKGIPYEIL